LNIIIDLDSKNDKFNIYCIDFLQVLIELGHIFQIQFKIILIEKKRLGICLRQNNRNIHNKPQASLDTKAEGIRMEQCGHLTFPIIKQYIEPEDVFTVTDSEMIEATKFTFKRLKLVIELSAGAAVAAVLSEKMKQNYPDLKNIAVLLCGGNIDIDNLPF
jgi:serine racemase